MEGKKAPAVQLADPADARAIARCFAEAYVGTYPIDEIGDATKLERRMASGATIFAVARDGDDVVGATALEPRGDRTGDLGHGAVLASHRKLGLFSLMNVPLIAHARERGIAVLFGRCVTSHFYSQRAMENLGARVAGLTLGAAPRTLRFSGIREQLERRESFFDYALVLAPRPRASVHAPRSLRAPLARAYALLGLELAFAPAPIETPRLRFAVERDDELGTATARFATRAPRPARALDEELEQLERDAEALYVELPLAAAGSRPIAGALNDRGFSFAAVLPGRAEGGGDLLRLQRLREEPSFEEIEVGSKDGEVMRSLVAEDYRAMRVAAFATG